ncbi:MAG: hypothetical protein ABL889_22385 [Terricaulis sp.]
MQGQIRFFAMMLAIVWSLASLVLQFYEAFAEHGPLEVFAVAKGHYDDFLSLLFGWLRGPLSAFGPPPTWWREGCLMTGLIIGQWYQVIHDGKAHWIDAAEYLLVALATAIGAYFIEAAQNPVQTYFFGVAGVFIQMIVRGALSFVRQSIDSEAWAGRYLITQTAIVAFSLLAWSGARATQSLTEQIGS